METENTRDLASKATHHLKRSVKRNIAKAWYKLDQQSYNQWLEGRKREQQANVNMVRNT